jgi:hypothetical protein
MEDSVKTSAEKMRRKALREKRLLLGKLAVADARRQQANAVMAEANTRQALSCFIDDESDARREAASARLELARKDLELANKDLELFGVRFQLLLYAMADGLAKSGLDREAADRIRKSAAERYMEGGGQRGKTPPAPGSARRTAARRGKTPPAPPAEAESAPGPPPRGVRRRPGPLGRREPPAGAATRQA